MAQAKIEPHKITKPIQLLAAWLTALVLLVGAFLFAASQVTNPPWLPVAFGITAIAMVPIFLGAIFLLQTKFRPQTLDDPYYAEYLRRQEEDFKGFQAENVMKQPSGKAGGAKARESWEEREQRRITIYEQHRGLFLVHTWRPSRIPGQIADIAISLHQHDRGPLTERKVRRVDYHLGPMFFDHPVVKTNAKDNFRLDVSAYGPMLCLATIEFTDGTPPLELERYINF